MKKNINAIMIIAGSVIMIFGIILFLSLMEKDTDNKVDQTVQIDMTENNPSPSKKESLTTSTKEKDEQATKDKAKVEQQVKDEQVAKDKAKVEQQVKDEQVAKDKAKAEQQVKDEQVAKDKAKAEQQAKKEQAAKSNNSNKPSSSNPGKNTGTIKPVIPDPNEDYNAYLEAIGVDMNEPNTIEVIEGVNAERGDTLFDD